jgi:hypothetical protein
MSERRKFRLRVEIEFWETEDEVPDWYRKPGDDLKDEQDLLSLVGLSRYYDEIMGDVISETAAIEEVEDA